MSAWTVIGHAELGSSGTFEFTSIPNTYTDLLVYVSARGITPFLGMRFNDSTSSLSARNLQGQGSTASSGTRSDTYIGSHVVSTNNSMTANTFSNVEIYIPNYAGNTNKSVSITGVTENNAALSWQWMEARLWSNTSAITSIQLYQWNSGDTKDNLNQYSSATLYGITKGSSGGVSVS